MNLENITLSERRQTRKATYLQFHLYEMTELGSSIGTESGRLGGVGSGYL